MESDQAGSSYRVETIYPRPGALPNERMLAAFFEEVLHQVPLARLTTSLAARIGDRRPTTIPNGKQHPASAASTENHTVSRRVFSWSKKPIRLRAVTAREAQDLRSAQHTWPLTSQRLEPAAHQPARSAMAERTNAPWGSGGCFFSNRYRGAPHRRIWRLEFTLPDAVHQAHWTEGKCAGPRDPQQHKQHCPRHTMSMKESEAFNCVGLVRSPVKRTPSGQAPAAAGKGLSGATTARMSTEGSVRSVSSSASAASEARRHNVLRPLAANSMFDNSVYSSGSACAHTPCPPSASPLDMMSLTISSKKKAVAAARRSHLPVSRTLKLSPAVDTTRQHQQESVMAEARTAAGDGSISSTPYSEAVDLTQRSITQSALFSTLDRLPPTTHGDASPSNQGKDSSPSSGSSNNNYRIQPSTPPPAAVGDISNIDDGRSGAWSDCSFTNGVFSPDPATPRMVYDGSTGSDGSDRGASARREQAPATKVSPIIQEEGHRPPAAEVAMCVTSSMGIANAHPSTTTVPACTPSAVSALLRMGGHSISAVPTPDSVAVDASRYRGYVARSPLATSGSSREEFGEEGGGVDVPNTPAAAATLAAMMMMGNNGSVRGSETGLLEKMGEEAEAEEEVRSFAVEDEMKDGDENSPAPTGLEVCAQGIIFVILIVPWAVVSSICSQRRRFVDFGVERCLIELRDLRVVLPPYSFLAILRGHGQQPRISRHLGADLLHVLSTFNTRSTRCSTRSNRCPKHHPDVTT